MVKLFTNSRDPDQTPQINGLKSTASFEASKTYMTTMSGIFISNYKIV